jgi:hypothetical protein
MRLFKSAKSGRMKKSILIDDKGHIDYDVEDSKDFQATKNLNSAYFLKAVVVVATCAAWTVISSVRSSSLFR